MSTKDLGKTIRNAAGTAMIGLAAIAADGCAGLMPKPEISSTHAQNYSYGLGGIEKSIPQGQYEARVWSAGNQAEEAFFYVLSKQGDKKLPFANEPEYTVQNLGIKSPKDIAGLIKQKYSKSADNLGEIVVESYKTGNGQVVYIIRKKDIEFRVSFGKLYLSGASTSQGGSGGGGGGAGSGGGGGGGGSGGK